MNNEIPSEFRHQFALSLGRELLQGHKVGQDQLDMHVQPLQGRGRACYEQRPTHLLQGSIDNARQE